MNQPVETTSLWYELLEFESVETLLYEYIGRAALANISLPTDSYSSHLANERKLLLRLIWTLDSQRFAKLIWPGRKPMIVKDALLRLLLHLIAQGSGNGANDGSKLSTTDRMVQRRLFLDCILSAFRLLMMTVVDITTDVEDVLRSRLDDMAEGWNVRHELSAVERSILLDLIPESLENNDETPKPMTPRILKDISVSILDYSTPLWSSEYRYCLVLKEGIVLGAWRLSKRSF
jgi:hypothetical protein